MSVDRTGSGSGGGSRRHHLLRHTLSAESSGHNAVHHFKASSIKDALLQVHAMSQRELQLSFEKVYGVKSSSNNNNWLRKKLVDGMFEKKIKKIGVST